DALPIWCCCQLVENSRNGAQCPVAGTVTSEDWRLDSLETARARHPVEPTRCAARTGRIWQATRDAQRMGAVGAGRRAFFPERPAYPTRATALTRGSVESSSMGHPRSWPTGRRSLDYGLEWGSP